jgi:hypothetical protein
MAVKNEVFGDTRRVYRVFPVSDEGAATGYFKICFSGVAAWAIILPKKFIVKKR